MTLKPSATNNVRVSRIRVPFIFSPRSRHDRVVEKSFLPFVFDNILRGEPGELVAAAAYRFSSSDIVTLPAASRSEDSACRKFNPR